ncbi:MAG: TlpA family protein disulfide reductase [Gemmataceae bacterium]|nr:TlpA family protein disulfide reductase [Gemmataceae bacterium]MCI0737422.1 TlpA family protein disulfide reductase [Gemmataceae bacterium]
MTHTILIRGFLSSCVLAAGAAVSAAPPPTVAQALAVQPQHSDISISTPTADELKECEVKGISGTRKGSNGWLILDGKKQPLRRFFDSNGDEKVDVWSYYKDGQEVLRETDSNFNQSKDQFRWLNNGGMKWGVDTNEDGKIDVWRLISSEEAAQEVFHALAQRDFDRLQALFITEAEMKALKLPAAQVQRLTQLQKGAPAKFQAALAKLPGLDKARFQHVEAAAPSCVPAEAIGAEQDLIKYSSRAILYEGADKKHDWIQTGEMIQVGLSWRLADAPTPGFSDPNDNPSIQVVGANPQLQPLLTALDALDKAAPEPLMTPKVDKAVQAYNLQRVKIVENILQVVKAEERENWYKQICDNLSAAAQAGSEESLARLGQFRAHFEKNLAGSNMAGFAAYRELLAIYTPKLASAKSEQEATKMHAEWHEKLLQFTKAYPKADDTPEALHTVAMGSEYSGKDEEAKRNYEAIYTTFPDHFLAEKARGAKKRLSLVGQPLELAGPRLGGGAPFDIAQLKGKVVVVYYWASYVDVCNRDFDTLKRLAAGNKDMELVCVSLDDNAENATKFLQKVQAPGIQLYQAPKDGAGLSSPYATHYGINGLPNLFLVGRDGRVLNRTLQVGDLETELKKAL